MMGRRRAFARKPLCTSLSLLLCPRFDYFCLWFSNQEAPSKLDEIDLLSMIDIYYCSFTSLL